MRRAGAILLLLFVPLTAAAAARLSFQRTIPARHDLGGVQDLAVTYAIGDNSGIDTFLEVFLEQTNRSGSLRVYDRTAVDTPGPHRRHAPPIFVQRPLRIAAFLRVSAFTCSTTERSGEVSSYDVDRNRVKKKLRWADAVCSAHLDVVAKGTNSKLAEVDSRGEGTSSRVEKVTEEDRAIAIDQAARYAAVVAAEEITPRKVRESIALVEEAPLFDEGMAYIDGDQLAEARRIWEAALARQNGSAGLHFNTGAVCEAMGDLAAADTHYDAALRLAPDDARYRYEHDAFRRRYGWKH